MALSVAYMLLPNQDEMAQEHPPRVITSASLTAPQITAFDGIEAAQEIYTDVSGFCSRNEKTCETAVNLTLKAEAFLQENLSKLGNAPDATMNRVPDRITTSSVN